MICIDLWYLHNAVFALTFGVSLNLVYPFHTKNFVMQAKGEKKTLKFCCVFCEVGASCCGVNSSQKWSVSADLEPFFIAFHMPKYTTPWKFKS